MTALMLAGAGLGAFVAGPAVAQPGGHGAGIGTPQGPERTAPRIDCADLSDSSPATGTTITDGDRLAIPVPRKGSGIYAQSYGHEATDDLFVLRENGGELEIRHCGPLPFPSTAGADREANGAASACGDSTFNLNSWRWDESLEWGFNAGALQTGSRARRPPGGSRPACGRSPARATPAISPTR